MSNLNNERQQVETELSLHPTEEAIVSEVQREFIEDELKELPPIKEGDVNISTTYVFDQGDKLELSIYIRNGLTKAVNFEKVPLVLVNSKNEVLAKQIFDLSKVGDVPACSVRPWKVYFDKENIQAEKFTIDDCKLAFDTNIKALSYVDVKLENLPKNFDDETIFLLQNYVDNLPKIEDGQVSISTFFVRENDDESISVTLILRNGSDGKIKLEKLPIKVYDKDGKLAAEGRFEDVNLDINPYKAIVREFVFLKDQRIPGEFNFEEWRVEF